MKIVKEGNLPMPPPVWPVDCGFECFHCHCEFVVEESDPFQQRTEKRPDGESVMFIDCPTCTVKLTAKRPSRSEAAFLLREPGPAPFFPTTSTRQ